MLVEPIFLLTASSVITYNLPYNMTSLAMDLKNEVHDGKSWFMGINSFLSGSDRSSNHFQQELEDSN